MLASFDLCSRDEVFLDDLITSQSMFVLSNIHAPDDPLIFASAAFCRFTQYPVGEIVGRNCRFLQGPHSDPADVGRLRVAVRDAKAVMVCVLNYKRDGTPFWNHLYLRPLYDRANQLVLMAGVQTHLKSVDNDVLFEQRPPMNEVLIEEFVDQYGCVQHHVTVLGPRRFTTFVTFFSRIVDSSQLVLSLVFAQSHCKQQISPHWSTHLLLALGCS
jgi:hypothetical protein